jgi:hypothetical protein
MRNTRPFLSLIFAVCLSSRGLRAQATPVAAPPCTVPGVGSPDSLWRQVRASGFTFCVPVSWKPGGHAHDSADAPQWKGDGTSVTWGLGRPVSGIGRSTTAEITGRIVRGSPGFTSLEPAPVRVHKCDPPTNTPLVVDQTVVMITQVRCEGVTWTTTGFSTTPAIYVQGEAHNEKVAELLVRVMRTIRFTSAAK